MDNVITLRKLIGLFLLFSLKTQKYMERAHELARPVMGTIFLVIVNTSAISWIILLKIGNLMVQMHVVKKSNCYAQRLRMRVY